MFYIRSTVLLHTDTVDCLLVNASVPVPVRFGWTTLCVMAPRPTLYSVIATTGALTTVDTMKTSPSRATPVPIVVMSLQIKHSMFLTLMTSFLQNNRHFAEYFSYKVNVGFLTLLPATKGMGQSPPSPNGFMQTGLVREGLRQCYIVTDP